LTIPVNLSGSPRARPPRSASPFTMWRVTSYLNSRRCTKLVQIIGQQSESRLFGFAP
jgi:hypothetical protein